MEARFTGLDARAGVLLLVKVQMRRDLRQVVLLMISVLQDLMHIVLRADSIICVQDTGVYMFD